MKTAAIVIAGLAVPALCDSAYGKKKLVSSEQLQRLITIESLLAGSQKLQDFADANGGNRAFGGAGHNATVDYLYKSLKATNYYNVYKQPFVELFTAATVAFSVDSTKYEALYMTYGPSGEVTGPLVAVSNLGCAVSDYPANLSGNVALISRGTCPFADKSTLAKAAGATAAIIYNNVPGSIQGTLGGVGNYVPTVGITQEVGNTLLTAIGAGSAVATLSVKTIEENRTTYNVIAETKEGDHNNVLVLGGHTDSVFAGPGINDDGSGTIGVLRVAEALTKFKVKNAVRFAFWSAEEFGLLGSKAYLRSINGTTGGSAAEVAKVRAYLNFDMIASPNYILGIYDGDGSAFNLTGPVGSDVIERDFQDFFIKKGLPSVPTIFSGRSDYAAFLENDIPSGGLFTGAEVVKTPEEAVLFGGEAGVAYDVNYHGAGDTIKNLAKDAYLINSKAIANSVAKYALSWKGIPKHGAINHRRTTELHQYFARFDHVHTHDHTAPCGQSAVAI